MIVVMPRDICHRLVHPRAPGALRWAAAGTATDAVHDLREQVVPPLDDRVAALETEARATSDPASPSRSTPPEPGCADER